jgi:hypothetical protein
VLFDLKPDSDFDNSKKKELSKAKATKKIVYTLQWKWNNSFEDLNLNLDFNIWLVQNNYDVSTNNEHKKIINEKSV